eukprot:12760644-Prorocentrum_lima.AAC.1
MTSSLVGSEMCIRDSLSHGVADLLGDMGRTRAQHLLTCARFLTAGLLTCLLYTSDAADDM